MERVSEHVWWHPPGPPDRPSLCAVVGDRWTLMLDAGSSRRHTREALAGLPSAPAAVAYTHAHWDHVFGGVEIGGLVIAHRRTAAHLAAMGELDWNDDANANDHIREELPAPREVEIAQADVVFDDALELDLGGVIVRIDHVESDHCDDACVMLVQPDRLLFVGDALCADRAVYTRDVALPLFDRMLAYDVDIYVEGHHPQLTTHPELEALLGKGRAAADGTVIAGDEDSEYFAAAFRAHG